MQRLEIFLAVRTHDQVDLAVAQRDGGRGFILDDAEMQCLDRSRATEVIFVAFEHDFRIHINMLQVIRPCADRIPAHLPVKIRHSPPRQDLSLMVIGNSVQEVAVGRVQLDHHSVRVGRLKPDDTGKLRSVWRCRGRVHDPLEAEDHIISCHLAIAFLEHHPFTQPEDPSDVVFCFPGGGQIRYYLASLAVITGQPRIDVESNILIFDTEDICWVEPCGIIVKPDIECLLLA